MNWSVFTAIAPAKTMTIRGTTRSYPAAARMRCSYIATGNEVTTIVASISVALRVRMSRFNFGRGIFFDSSRFSFHRYFLGRSIFCRGVLGRTVRRKVTTGWHIDIWTFGALRCVVIMLRTRWLVAIKSRTIRFEAIVLRTRWFLAIVLRTRRFESAKRRTVHCLAIKLRTGWFVAVKLRAFRFHAIKFWTFWIVATVLGTFCFVAIKLRTISIEGRALWLFSTIVRHARRPSSSLAA